MRILVTAGPTYENLDRVRRLTNLSTGGLGIGLASFLTRLGHEVILLLGYYSTHRERPSAIKTSVFTTTADLAAQLESHAHQPFAAVFHAAAVSDFSFGPVYHRAADGTLIPVTSGKFSTRSGPMLAELVPTPKIIAQLRGWFPHTYLVGWKYEVDGSQESALKQGRQQLVEHHTNGCVVNGPAYGPGFGWVTKVGTILHLPDKPCLYEHLAGQITEV
jgi:phosphopantothenate---cysteine ligase (CTP)